MSIERILKPVPLESMIMLTPGVLHAHSSKVPSPREGVVLLHIDDAHRLSGYTKYASGHRMRSARR